MESWAGPGNEATTLPFKTDNLAQKCPKGQVRWITAEITEMEWILPKFTDKLRQNAAVTSTLQHTSSGNAY